MRESSTKNDLKIWYDRPAKCWSQGLPMGNGHMGVMLYGGIAREKLDLSEVTCFSGSRDEGNNQLGASEVFYKMREAHIQGDYEKAQELSKGFIGVRNNYGTNLPVGHLFLNFPKGETIEEYRRELDLDTAISTVTYKQDQVEYTRRAFVSNPDQVAVLQVKANKLKSLSFELSLDGGDNPYKVTIDSNNDILLEGQAYESRHSDGKTGVDFHGRVRVMLQGGTLAKINNKLMIQDADQALIIMALKTNFEDMNPKESCKELVSTASEKSFEELYKEHIKDYQRLFHRVGLNLSRTAKVNEVSTDRRLERVIEGGEDNSLTALMFQYGRYLLIASSRENSLLPTPLQGVWNDNVACQIGWTCDMHLDINTQMNYWPAEVTNLSECHLPLFRWIEERLIPSGRITARTSYGLTGWVAELVSNAWGFSAPYWAKELSPCPTGGIWILSHLWEHYLFNKDNEFLRQKCYPQMREAVEFFTQYLFEDKKTGFLTSGPSISPENSFLKDGKQYFASIGPTYEIVLIRELLEQFAKASCILGIENELTIRATKMLRRLLPFQIGSQGELKEWSHDFPAKDPQHRHTSHLLSLYPFSQITPSATPELAKAAKRSIELNLTPKETWEDTGWARSMLMLYSARLGEPEDCLEHIHTMQRQLTHSNLLVKHPSTRGASAFDDVYELDGNTGLTSCIAEMLVQSHQEEIHILPALPRQWENGSVTGLCARGGFEVDINWHKGVLSSVSIKARQEGICAIRYKDKKIEILMETGKIYVLNSKLQKTPTYD